MDDFLKLYWRAVFAVGVVERTLGMTLVALIVIMITVQVVTRYVFNQPIVWVEDVATFAFIWATFLGAAVALKEMRHIRIDTFVNALPAKARDVVYAGLYLVIVICCVVVAYYARGIMGVEARSSTISLPVNLPRHWFYSVPLFVGLVSMAITAAYFVIAHLASAVVSRPIDAHLENAAIAARERELDEVEARIIEKSLKP